MRRIAVKTATIMPEALGTHDRMPRQPVFIARNKLPQALRKKALRLRVNEVRRRSEIDMFSFFSVNER